MTQGTANRVSPPPGRKWLVVAGVINHVTGTTTVLYKTTTGKNPTWATVLDLISNVDTAQATGAYAVFNTLASAQSAFSLHIIDSTENDFLVLTGNAAATAKVVVIEW